MKVTLGPNGELELKELFTKKELNKIVSYSIDKSDMGIRLFFYDINSDEVFPKLRTRRGQAKKA